MWFVFSLFLLLWVASVEFYFPVFLILALFAAMLTTAGLAMVSREALE